MFKLNGLPVVAAIELSRGDLYAIVVYNAGEPDYPYMTAYWRPGEDQWMDGDYGIKTYEHALKQAIKLSGVEV